MLEQNFFVLWELCQLSRPSPDWSRPTCISEGAVLLNTCWLQC